MSEALRTRLLRSALSSVGSVVTPTYRKLAVWKGLLYTELTSGLEVSIPLRRRLWLWRRGFISHSDAYLDLDERTYPWYLSDYEESLTEDVNGEWSVANNKLVGHWLLEPFDEHRPHLYGMVTDGRVVYRSLRRDDADARRGDGGGTQSRSADAFAVLDAALRECGSVILKPVAEFGGKGVVGCSRSASGFRLDGEPVDRDELADFVSSRSDYLVFERVEQAPYADRLYPDATNTIRILTMWDYDADEPFVAEAVHRIGVAESAPADNWSRNGLAAPVDRDTGVLEEAAHRASPTADSLHWHAAHPETGAQIAGVQVPHWAEVRDGVLEIAAFLSFVPYVGWDVVVTADGFSVIELNAGAGVFQELGPAKTDPRARRFFEHNDVLVNDPENPG